MSHRSVFTLRRFDPKTGPGCDLSEHPDIKGAKLSALEHVANGDSIAWADGPYGGTWYGVVVGANEKFCIVKDM